MEMISDRILIPVVKFVVGAAITVTMAWGGWVSVTAIEAHTKATSVHEQLGDLRVQQDRLHQKVDALLLQQGIDPQKVTK